MIKSTANKTDFSDQTLAQLARFGAVGVVSTVAYTVLFLLMQGWAGAQPANVIALLLTALGNTAANRRFTST